MCFKWMIRSQISLAPYFLVFNLSNMLNFLSEIRY